MEVVFIFGTCYFALQKALDGKYGIFILNLCFVCAKVRKVFDMCKRRYGYFIFIVYLWYIYHIFIIYL